IYACTYSFQGNVFIPKIIIGYAPNTTPGIRQLIANVIQSISTTPIKINSYADCEELRIRAYSGQFIASVCFHDVSDESQRGLPLKLHFSILMPSELRHYEDTWIGNNWEVNRAFDTYSSSYIEIENSTYSSYVREGFITLQYHICREYLLMASGGANIPAVVLREFDQISDIDELITEGVDTSVLVLLLGFMFPVTIFTKEIVEERAQCVHFALHIDQSATRVQYAVWYLNGVCMLLITCVILTLVLKINWLGYNSVFSQCPWYIMLFFFSSYIMAAVGFCLLMAVILKSTRMVVAILPIYWLLITLPLLSGKSLETSWSQFILIAATICFCNVTMCRGLRRILCFEKNVGASNVKKYLVSTLMTSDPTLLRFIGFFYIQTLLYVLLALFLDGNIFPYLLKLLKCRPCHHSMHRLHSRSESEIVEVLETRPVVIEFKSVWKKYLHHYVIRNFSLKVYQNEIMVVLGHNGAGKTALLNMLCDRQIATAGTVTINGFNVEKQKTKAYDRVGMSMHNLLVFNEFTVFEHLVYFCRLRGLSLEQSDDDVSSYLNALKMDEQREQSVSTLTIGDRRLLQALSAFAGRTTVVILDKPMEGVDARRRGLFYRFALREKKRRTVFITTNLTNVASNLGDRISILVNGRLYACAPEKTLLRTHVTTAYRVVCYLGKQCTFDNLFNYFALHIPSIELELRMGDLAIFLIEYIDLNRLLVLMKGLSSISKDLGLDSYQVVSPGLDTVLTRAMQVRKYDQSSQIAGMLYQLTHQLRFIHKKKELKKLHRVRASISRLFTHLEVVIRKRFLMDLRNLLMPLVQIFLPSLLCAWTLCMPHLVLEREVFYSHSLTMERFNRAIILLKQMVTLDPLVAASRHYMEPKKVDLTILELAESDDFLEYIQAYMTEHNIITDLNFVVAAIFKDDSIVALFNGNLMHAAPVSLTRVMEALAVGFVGPGAGINVTLELLPYSTLHTVFMSEGISCLDWELVIITSFCFCFVWALPLLNFGLGRETPYSRFEMIAGMRFGTLSIANFVYGMFKTFLSLIPLNAVILLFNNAIPWSSFDNYLFFYIIMISGIYVMTIDVAVSYFLSEMRIGYIIITTIYSMGIVIYLALFEMQGDAFKQYSDKLVLAFHPYFALVRNLMHRNNFSEIATLCSDVQTYETSIYVEQCLLTPNCCYNVTKDFLFLDHTWSTYLLIVLLWAILYIRPTVRRPKTKSASERDSLHRGSDPDSQYDQTVLHFGIRTESNKAWINEKLRVRTLESPMVRMKALKVENLSVCFGRHVVLNRINFMVERYQVTSVVGANGSGKSVLINSLLGAMTPTTGTIINYGIHTHEYWKKEHYQDIGFCPQENSILDALTILEVLTFMLLIRGIKKAKVSEHVNMILKIFDLYESRHCLLPNCSRGILKRMSIALSLVGCAGIILMDDPFAYLDVPGLRKVYAIIEAHCSTGQAVLYTSTDARYCDWANRTAILKPPSVCVIGERQELQLKHYAGYTVVETRIKIDE
ncbi:hypothetical protein KR222_004405, partial [Zaprionus bogoriensis]